MLVRGTGGTTATMTFEGPAQYAVEEASWSLISNTGFSTFVVNDNAIRASSGVATFQNFAVDTSHVFVLKPRSTVDRMGVAVGLVLQ